MSLGAQVIMSGLSQERTLRLRQAPHPPAWSSCTSLHLHWPFAVASAGSAGHHVQGPVHGSGPRSTPWLPFSRKAPSGPFHLHQPVFQPHTWSPAGLAPGSASPPLLAPTHSQLASEPDCLWVSPIFISPVIATFGSEGAASKPGLPHAAVRSQSSDLSC